MESIVLKIKQSMSLLVGVTITATLVQVLFAFHAVRFNYYSGRDPSSTVDFVLIYVPIEITIGALILLVLRLFKQKIIQEPNEFFLLGVILGFGNLGGGGVKILGSPWVY